VRYVSLERPQLPHYKFGSTNTGNDSLYIKWQFSMGYGIRVW